MDSPRTEDQRVRVNLWRFLHGDGIDRAQFGGQEATEHLITRLPPSRTVIAAYRLLVTTVVAAMGCLRGDGMGRSFRCRFRRRRRV